MGQIKKIIQEFILGGLIIHHSLTLGQEIWPLKKIYILFGNQWKVVNYTGSQKKNLLSNIQRIFGQV